MHRGNKAGRETLKDLRRRLNVNSIRGGLFGVDGLPTVCVLLSLWEEESPDCVDGNVSKHKKQMHWTVQDRSSHFGRRFLS